MMHTKIDFSINSFGTRLFKTYDISIKLKNKILYLSSYITFFFLIQINSN